jgi:FixJ family two-component response regulator
MLADTPQAAPCVHVVDDDDSFRGSMLRLLEASGFQASGYRCAGEFLLTDALDRPGCVLLDITMPGLNGMDVLKALRARPTAPPIVLLTGFDDVLTSVDAMKSGAIDYLVKPVKAEKVLECVVRALRIDAQSKAAQQETQVLRRRVELLTASERKILLGIAHNKLNKQLAAELGSCERTVKAQRARIRAKLQLRSLPDLVRASKVLEHFLARADGADVGCQ